MSEENSLPVDEQEQIARRRAKLGELRESGVAFPNDFRRTAFAKELHQQWGVTDAEALEARDQEVADA